jgi:N-acetylmuramoyl-L-alanine amidase CwlD
MKPLRAKPGRFAAALALALWSSQVAACPVAAQPAPVASDGSFWFAGTQLVFDHPQMRSGQLAVATDDAGLLRLLAKLGATLAYQAGEKYVVITGADRRTISFTLGDASYTAAGTTYTAPFAPYVAASTAWLPFLDVARALALQPVDDGAGTTVLQPQLAGLDIRSSGRVTFVTLHAATPLQFKRLSDDGDQDVVLAFGGLASTLEPDRVLPGAALRGITIDVSGPARNPTTVVHFVGARGALHALVPGDAPNELTLAFAPPGVDAGGIPIPAQSRAQPVLAAAPPAPQQPPLQAPLQAPMQPAVVPNTSAPSYEPQAANTPLPTADTLPPATIASVVLEPGQQSYALRVVIDGNVTYEWHRLSDNRWYVDLKPALLTAAPIDEEIPDPTLLALRVKAFVGPNDHLPTVRIALTLGSPRVVALQPFAGGVTIAIGSDDDQSPLRSDVGEIENGQVSASVVPLPAPSATAAGDQVPAVPPGWKFAPLPPPNARLIVIDPGHGGSDTGAMHNGLVEKAINLDISERLRALLIARGWQVKMTRDTDADVYAPNDSARDELQARCDIANHDGARLFVSVHTNSFTSGSLKGTTTYYFKPDSYALAQAVHARLAATLPTQDDGILKDNFYVIHHTNMPSILVETAFLSNAGDAAYLRSPDFLQKVASGIANGIGDYTATAPPYTSNGAQNTDGN